MTREQLQAIRDEAEKIANVVGISSNWRRMWLALSDAANVLDAFLARIQINA